MTNFREAANFIWSVADLLRCDYKQAEYGKAILPLTILRHLVCVLEPTKEKVLKKLKSLSKTNETDLSKNSQSVYCSKLRADIKNRSLKKD